MHDIFFGATCQGKSLDTQFAYEAFFFLLDFMHATKLHLFYVIFTFKSLETASFQGFFFVFGVQETNGTVLCTRHLYRNLRKNESKKHKRRTGVCRLRFLGESVSCDTT